ncbi:mannonate dehydratase [Halieaceae bacterium IMCC14734]|uniref:Mannonate dehydratase n=1 Tax=Candidatus Litorirhabdus singularis TaxID=2518993 RepID=A0ABT3TIP6_9GAMM|nr:mannonate dehydratase [Candidatus Litorirhabdus singularis]MCX2982188.1 mannonate dehydratase [Candidatus Litorirhabdus singularis]
MQETWRWFGPQDTVTLENIVQAGASGVVTSLHHIGTGAAWPLADVKQRKAEIEAAGLHWSVVESIPLHNDIKTRSGDYQRYIANYQESLRHVGAAGIEVVCYNFMPVVDWTRTNLMYELPNASRALRFEMTDFVAYDVYMLERENAAADYAPELLQRASERFAAMNEEQRALLERNIIAGLPGGEGSYDRAGIRDAIAQFIAMGTERMRDNLFQFLAEVVPVAEAAGVRLCIHPDDPPFSLFGLPRVVSTAADARALLAAVPSPSNGLTLCAGSFGARGDNDLIAMAREFGPDIHFVHLRNVRRESDGSFYESEHLDGDNDMVGLIEALLDEESRRQREGRSDGIPMRPDHGHLMGDEIGRDGVNPGYSFGGRLKGLAELRGVMHTLETLRSRNPD